MRKVLVAAAALAATVAAAAPAAAQYRDHDRYGRGGWDNSAQIDRQLGRITDRIQRLRYQRQISGGEANRLLRQADQIDRLEDRYSRDGLSRWERDDLQRRLQALRSQIRWERNDDRYGYDRGDRYDRDDRYDRYDDRRW